MKETTRDKKIAFFLFVLLIMAISFVPYFLSNSARADSSIYYVSVTGSNSNSGTFNNPWRTIQKAVDESAPGDTIYIREGNYNEHIYIRTSGTTQNPILISGYDGEDVIINGDGLLIPPANGLFSLWTGSTAKSNIIFRNLILENSSQNGICTLYYSQNPTNNIRIENCTFLNIAYRALNFWGEGSSNSQIENINVQNCSFLNIQTSVSSGEGITFFGCKNIVFTNNSISKCRKISIDVCNNSENILICNNRINTTSSSEISGEGIYIDGGQNSPGSVHNVTISNNLIWGERTGIALASETNGCLISNIQIYNNIINITQDSTSHGIACTYSTKHQYNVTIRHNTIFKQDGLGAAINLNLNDGYIHNFIVANNILVSGGSTDYQLRTSFSHLNSELQRHSNLYFHTTKNSNTYFDGTKNIFENNAILEHPKFVEIGINFHLLEDSIAIDSASSFYGVDIDYDNIMRPQGNGYDIGGFEFISDCDITPPQISNIELLHSIPMDTEIGWENISCSVLDDVAVDRVVLNILSDGWSEQNIVLNNQLGTSNYYWNFTLTQPGIYTYQIYAYDVNDNVVISTELFFNMAANWDINKDGECTILDHVLISNHFNEMGPNGWIREDLDNNGIINVLDLTLASNNFNESWL